jgi:hypothetical protein
LERAELAVGQVHLQAKEREERDNDGAVRKVDKVD